MAMPSGNSHQLLGRLAVAVLRRGGSGSGHIPCAGLTAMPRQPSPTPSTALRPFTCAHGPLRKHQKFPTKPEAPPEGPDPELVKKAKALTKMKLKRNQLPPRPTPPPEEEIEEKFLKGSGAGGQKINKTNSAVQLRHIPTGIVVKSQATRSQSQNREIARQLLADKLDDLAHGEMSRSSVIDEFRRRRKASSTKKNRRKYRDLEERAELVFLNYGEAYVPPGGEEEEDNDNKDDDAELEEGDEDEYEEGGQREERNDRGDSVEEDFESWREHQEKSEQGKNEKWP